MVAYGLLLISLPVLSLWGPLCRFPCLSLLGRPSSLSLGSLSLAQEPTRNVWELLFLRFHGRVSSPYLVLAFEVGLKRYLTLILMKISLARQSHPITSHLNPPACVLRVSFISQVPFPPSLPLHPAPWIKSLTDLKILKYSRLLGHWAQGSACLCLPRTGSVRADDHTRVFKMWVLGNTWLRSSCFWETLQHRLSCAPVWRLCF